MLELIPENQKTPQQKIFRRWRYGNDVPLYRLTRELSSLDEIDWEKYGEFAIWRDNGTVICVCKYAFDSFVYSAVCFRLSRVGKHDISGAIFGLIVDDFGGFSKKEINEMIDDNIAETAAFFWSLKDSNADDKRLEIDRFDEMSRFNFAALHSDQLAAILDANPRRQFELQNGTWSAEQAVILATRPFSVKLKLSDSPLSVMESRFRFRDKGAAFVNALEKRNSSFGSLALSFLNTTDIPFSVPNMERLLKCQFDKLEIGVMHQDLALLPFASNTAALDYKIDSDNFDSRDFYSLQIVAKDIDLTVVVNGDRDDYWNWDTLLIAFLNRVATLGHFERLGVSARYWHEDQEGWARYKTKRVALVAEALVDAIRANPKLSCLDLSDTESIVKWGPHLEIIRKAIENHEASPTFLVRGDDSSNSVYSSDDYDSEDDFSNSDNEEGDDDIDSDGGDLNSSDDEEDDDD